MERLVTRQISVQIQNKKEIMVMTKVKVARNSPVSAAIVAKVVIKLISVGITTKILICVQIGGRKKVKLNSMPYRKKIMNLDREGRFY